MSAAPTRGARRLHRVLSLLFTLVVLANFAYRGLQGGEPPAWLSYAPLPPLALLMLSGLYLLLRPYLGRFSSSPAA
jgi:hypothetical protein